MCSTSESTRAHPAEEQRSHRTGFQGDLGHGDGFRDIESRSTDDLVCSSGNEDSCYGRGMAMAPLGLTDIEFGDAGLGKAEGLTDARLHGSEYIQTCWSES